MSNRNHSLDLPILMSAKKEFLHFGFEKASLKVICENANVTTGALYKRYKGKEELFNAVVADTVTELEQVLADKTNIGVEELSDETLINAWDMDMDVMLWWFNLLFDNYDGFCLLLTGAEGTTYSNFQHDWVEQMTKETYKYYREAYSRGLAVNDVSEKELHSLLSAYWTTIYEPFIHGFTRDEIESYCGLVCKFINWQEVLGLPINNK